MNGAHKTTERYTPRHTTAKSSSSSTDKKYNFNFKPRIHVRKNPLDNLRELELLANKDRAQSAPSSRKKWTHSNSSLTIKTTDGYEIKINAPNFYKHETSKSDITSDKKNIKHQSNDCEYYYSDDFESESESDTDDKKKTENASSNKKDLIQSVQFSDLSDEESDEEANKPVKTNVNNKNKRISLRLSQNDIKVI